MILAVYVDDLILATTDEAMHQDFKDKLFKRFRCKDLGPLERALNMEVSRTKEGGLFLSQKRYVEDVLEKFLHPGGALPSKVNGCLTPMEHKLKLVKGGAVRTSYTG
jgi:Reverse transcriptase (RNA-dependent DNA polymerase)